MLYLIIGFLLDSYYSYLREKVVYPQNIQNQTKLTPVLNAHILFQAVEVYWLFSKSFLRTVAPQKAGINNNWK